MLHYRGQEVLRTHHSNRLEVLVETLAARLLTAGPDPFEPEVVVVPNQGMARWVSQRLALRNGIVAQVDYPLPATFFWRMLKAWLPKAPDQDAYQRGALAWRLFRLLPGLIDSPPFQDLKRYLDAEVSDLRRFELAAQLADLFDQYLIYRPDLCRAFEEGGGEGDWQAILWRIMANEIGSAHRASLLAELDRAVSLGAGPVLPLPPRVSLFGVGSLAPVQVQMLGALSRYTDVALYYLSPCREYWADVAEPRQLARRRARASRAGLADPTGMLDIGNPLLASLGHAGQAFLDQLLELGGADEDHFVAPVGDSLLAHLQRDILDLADRRAQEPTARTPISDHDLSFRVHGAHGPLREVQVLHDRLLDLFAALPGLEPRDIVVMAPDMALYAPYVDAVFGTAEKPLRIPWAIADRKPGADQSLAGAITALMALRHSRLPATEVLALLAVPAVQRRFAISERVRERLAQWIADTGIRWGLDEGTRRELELPAERLNTWAFGLGRLFLGYAMPTEWAEAPYRDLLPYPDIDVDEVEALGVLQSLIDALAEWRRQLASPRVASDWAEAINRLLETFFVFAEDAELTLVDSIRSVLGQLVRQQDIAGVEDPLSADLVAAILRQALDEPAGAHGFLTGRTTFTNMVPMRSIPHRVVAILGMNGDAFPRSQCTLSFDRIAAEPRRGDRSRRRDDRYLFLECLLAARGAIHISWTARSARDNTACAPSVVVAEVLDYIDASFRLPGVAKPTDALVIHHPLQPFSQEHFDGTRSSVASHSSRWCAAARAAIDGTATPFITTPLADPDPALRRVELADLLRFLGDPAGYFLRQRLGLRLPHREDAQTDEEPFVIPAGLERYALRSALLEGRQRAHGPEQIIATLRAMGALPHGALGEQEALAQLQIVDNLMARGAKWSGANMAPVEVDLAIGLFRLQGELHHLTDSGLLLSRPARLKPKDRLAAWVRHLVLCALAPGGVALRTAYVAEDYTLVLSAVDDPGAVLANLLDLYWEGLTHPIPFFPASSFAWLEKGTEEAVEAQWLGGANGAAEGDSLAVRIAFRGLTPFGEAFKVYAQRVYRPLLAVSTLIRASQEP